MVSVVDIAKKLSSAMGFGLQNYYYYRITFPKFQRQLIKEHPYKADKAYEREAIKYYKYISNGRFRLNPMWHSFYAYNNGIYDKRYIPENLYFGKLEPYFNRKDLAKGIDDKCFYDIRFDTSICHIPQIIIRNIGGTYFDSGYNIVTKAEAADIIQGGGYNEAVFKLSLDGKGGHGVEFLKVSDETEIFRAFERFGKNFVVTEPIKQTGVLHQINPSSVNTVRFMTYMHDNEVTLLSAVLRMGGTGSRVDNASSGGIFCGITDDGITKLCGWNKKFNKFDRHPNGNKFSGIRIPNYDKAADIVKRQHMRLGHFRIVSWDVAISEDEIYIIEFNLMVQEIDFHQMCNGPLFGAYTDKVLWEYFNHK